MAQKSLEDIVEKYLMVLIKRSRSLVVVGKKGSDGATKTCCVHDLSRDLCLRKAMEENFSLVIYRYINIAIHASIVTGYYIRS